MMWVKTRYILRMAPISRDLKFKGLQSLDNLRTSPQGPDEVSHLQAKRIVVCMISTPQTTMLLIELVARDPGRQVR